MNKTTQKSLKTSNNSNSDINVDIPKWNDEGIGEEEDIKCRRKSHAETVN